MIKRGLEKKRNRKERKKKRGIFVTIPDDPPMKRTRCESVTLREKEKAGREEGQQQK
jgi:hypothetical protein